MSSSRSTTPSRGSSPAPRRGLLVGGIVAALVVVALVVAVVASGGDDDDEAQDTPAATTVAGSDGGAGAAPGEAVGAAEQQPVTIEGAALSELGDGDDPAVGTTAPTLQGYSFDGSPLEVAAGGTDKMIVFLAHWCPHCNREVPRLLQWQEEGRVPDGLEVIGVATGSDENSPNYPPSAWLQDLGWTWPTLADSTEHAAAQAYGVSGFPFFAIVGADGTVKARFSGEMDVDDLDAAVRDALATPA